MCFTSDPQSILSFARLKLTTYLKSPDKEIGLAAITFTLFYVTTELGSEFTNLLIDEFNLTQTLGINKEI